MSVPARELIEEVLERVDMGALPETYRRLMQVLDAPDASTGQVADAIQIDPGLTAGLLAVANSAAYSPHDPVTTVARASLMLGRRQLREMALARSVVRMFRSIPEHLLDMRSFWTHSVAVGMLCQQMAGRLALPPVDAWFTAGLLHDVGLLAVCVTRPRAARDVIMQTENLGEPIEAIEREMWGVDHAEIGARLGRSWGLPSWLVTAIRWHHDPGFAAPGRPRRGAQVVHVADVVVSALQIGNGGERAANGLDPEAWDGLGLTVDEVEGMLHRMEHQVESLSGALFG